MACVDENRLVPTKILSFLLKFTTEKFKSTGKAAEKRTSGLRYISFSPKVIFMTFTLHTIKAPAEKNFKRLMP